MGMIDIVVASLLAHAPGFELEEYWSVHLREREDAKPKHRKDPYRLDILGPPPAKVRVGCKGCANDGTYRRSSHDSDGVKSDRGAPRLGLPHVAQRGSDVANGSRAEYAAEEACNEDGGCVLASRSAYREQAEAEHRGQHRPSSTPYLRDGCPQEGTEGEAQAVNTMISKVNTEG